MWRESICTEMEDILSGIKSSKKEVGVEEIKNKKVLLYGAGIDGIKVLSQLEKHRIDVIGFFDIRADSIPDIKNLPVVRPDKNIVPEGDKADIPVILTVKPFKPRNEAIVKTLLEQGYTNIIKATDMFDFYSFTRKDRSELERLSSSIIECARLLEDKTSYDIFKGFIASHATKQYDTFSAPTENTKYFDSDFDEKKGYQRYIDCGAFNGDTLRDLYRLKGRVQRAALFESDMDTFRELMASIGAEDKTYAEEMTLFPCGVWSDTMKLRANNGMGLNSHISGDGDDIIQCVSLDQVLKGFQPTFIKMDVEGAEFQALHGARKMIVENKPDMVVSLYHDLRDIWELPLLINSWDLGYKFFIRAYGKGGNATMLYCFAG